MRLRPLLIALAYCAVQATAASGQAPPAAAEPPTPAAPMSTAWLPYAQSLVRQDRAVAVVLRESDMYSRSVSELALPDRSTVTEFTQGIVTRLVSDAAGRCREALARPLLPLLLRGTPLSVLHDVVMQDAEASARRPPGIVGGAVGGLAPSRAGERLGQRITMRVDAGDTFGTALDRLVSTAIPLGWGVIEHDDASSASCQIILFTEDTVLMTPYDALFPVPSPAVPQ